MPKVRDLPGRCRTLNRNAPMTARTPRTLWIISSAALVLLSGCATTPYRANTQFEERLRSGLRVAVMPPDVKVYQITAGEMRDQMDEWSETARTSVLAAIDKRLTRSGRLTIRGSTPSYQRQLGRNSRMFARPFKR